MAANFSTTSNEVKALVRWIRQEYKSNKDKFEKPFKITIEKELLEHTKTDEICLEQSYSALGTTVWDGSIALAKMFEKNSRLSHTYLKQSKVLELGAGCGLVGITLSLLGAKSVILSDLELCLPTLQRNVDKNVFGRAKQFIRVMPFVWGQDTSPLTVNGKFELVVAAEVLYDEKDSKLLAESVVQTLSPEGVMYVALGRNRNGETTFVRTMREHGYSVNEVGEKADTFTNKHELSGKTQGKECSFSVSHEVAQGHRTDNYPDPVVQKPVSANPRLTVIHCFGFPIQKS